MLHDENWRRSQAGRRASPVFRSPQASSGFFLLFSLAQKEWMIWGCLSCYCTVKECELPERNLSFELAACVLIRCSRVGHLANISSGASK